MPARHHGIELRRGDRARRHLELADDAELRHLLHPGADAPAREAGAAEGDQHMVADAGIDDRQRALDRGDGRGAAHRRGGREAQVLDAEIGDEVLGDRAVAVGDHAVDVAGLQAGILDGVQRRLQLQGQRAPVGAAHVACFADAGDGARLAQGHVFSPVFRRPA
jgi:hypothetical protein